MPRENSGKSRGMRGNIPRNATGPAYGKTASWEAALWFIPTRRPVVVPGLVHPPFLVRTRSFPDISFEEARIRKGSRAPFPRNRKWKELQARGSIHAEFHLDDHADPLDLRSRGVPVLHLEPSLRGVVELAERHARVARELLARDARIAGRLLEESGSSACA